MPNWSDVLQEIQHSQIEGKRLQKQSFDKCVKFQTETLPGDLFRFWNSHPNTIYAILRFHKSRRPDESVDWRNRKDAIAADVQAANLGDGTVERVPVVILNSAQVCKVEACD